MAGRAKSELLPLALVFEQQQKWKKIEGENRNMKKKMEKTVFNNAVDVVVVAATVDIYWCCFLSSLIYHSEGISYIAATFVS